MKKLKKQGRGKAVRKAIRRLNRIVSQFPYELYSSVSDTSGSSTNRHIRRASEALDKRVRAVEASHKDAKRRKK